MIPMTQDDPNNPSDPNDPNDPNNPNNPNNPGLPGGGRNPNDPSNPGRPGGGGGGGRAQLPVDPLVLDLDGDGIELSSVAQSQTYFDFDGDGFAERTGWVGPDDAFLVRDRNSNGRVDNGTELFGNANLDGFAALSSFDLNVDGKIDVGDIVFSELKIWRDINGNGISESLIQNHLT